jgi:TolB-like protein/Tfp pilus assembly protein PilF
MMRRGPREASLEAVAARWLAVALMSTALLAGAGCQQRAAREEGADGAQKQNGAAAGEKAGGNPSAAVAGDPAPAPRGYTVIAILPFENASGDAGAEEVATGLAEELARMAGGMAPEDVRFIAPESARWFQRTGQEPAAALADLGAQFVVRGRANKASEIVTIEAQMLSTSDGGTRWSDTRTCDMKDAGMQLKDVARHVLASATGRDADSFTDREPARGAARFSMVYETYVRGRADLVELTPETLEETIEEFTSILNMDFEFRPTYLGIGLCHAYAGDLPSGKWGARMNVVKARSRGMKSMEKSDEFCEARALAALAQQRIDETWTIAEDNYRRSIALNPSYVTARIWYSDLLAASKRHDEAIAQAEAARAIDPLSAGTRAVLGERRLDAGDLAGAARDFEAALMLDAASLPARVGLAECHRRAGRFDEALAAAQAAADQSERATPALAALARIHAAAGRSDDARKVLTEMEARRKEAYVSSYAMAQVSAALGDTEAAFGFLDLAVVDRPRALMFLDVDPALDGIRSDPRFASVRQEIGVGVASSS